MKRCTLTFLLSSAIFCSLGVHASESLVKESKPIGTAPTLSKEEVKNGIENGTLCTDTKGLAYSLGAVIKENGSLYRCVKGYGENLTENKKLFWVELTEKMAKP